MIAVADGTGGLKDGEAHLREFGTQGYTCFPQVFSPQEMGEIDAACERLYGVAVEVAKGLGGRTSAVHQGARFTYAAGTTHVRHVAMCGNAEAVLMRYGRDTRLLEIASLLLGHHEMEHLINQVHYKRPGSNVTFDWHQDATHRRMATGGFRDLNGLGSYAQLLLAVDDSSAENGGLQFIPGSNQMGFVASGLADRIDAGKAVTPMLHRGDIVAFGPYTVHGSQPNRSERSRRVFINGFAQAGANRADYGLPHAGERLPCG